MLCIILMSSVDAAFDSSTLLLLSLVQQEQTEYGRLLKSLILHMALQAKLSPSLPLSLRGPVWLDVSLVRCPT